MTSYIIRVRQWFGVKAAAMRADDRGAITTETAVVTFLLIGVAILVVGLISTYAEGVVGSFPTP
jgi:Flp pilus assembly protein TadG